MKKRVVLVRPVPLTSIMVDGVDQKQRQIKDGFGNFRPLSYRPPPPLKVGTDSAKAR
jgi:hypothetical protein